LSRLSQTRKLFSLNLVLSLEHFDHRQVRQESGEDGRDDGEAAGKGRAGFSGEELHVAQRHADHGADAGAGATETEAMNPETSTKKFF